MANILKLVISLVVCQLAGFIGSIFTTPAINTWYAGLNRAIFSPPNWIFAPVWITLFLMMGCTLYLLWKANNKKAIAVFFIQLGLNVLWSIIFFGMKNPGLAFIEIIILWIAILVSIISSYKVSKTAGLLLIPYIIWVSFASFLNYSIWVLN